MALFDRAGEVCQLDVADMREQIAERTARLQAGRCAAVAVVAGRGMRELYEGLGAFVVDGGRDLQPLDLRPARRDPRGAGRGGPGLSQQPERGDGRRAAAELSDKEARVVPCTSQQAGVAGAGRARPDRVDRARTPSG